MQPYEHLEASSAEEILRWAIARFGRRLAIVTSFQAEGMVALDMAVAISPDVRVITLDTGRLPAETHDMMEMVRARYRIPIEVVVPDSREVETMAGRFGTNLFYESTPLRSLCCNIRKVRPLERKLQEFDAWVTGLRRSQSDTRGSLGKVSTVDGRTKISPLADWSRQQIEDYTRAHDVPVHPLYAQGYTSIGCGPCTRATTAGEDERAGRWWWESGSGKECGIHFSPDGRIERTIDVLLREVTAAAHSNPTHA